CGMCSPMRGACSTGARTPGSWTEHRSPRSCGGAADRGTTGIQSGIQRVVRRLRMTAQAARKPRLGEVRERLNRAVSRIASLDYRVAALPERQDLLRLLAAVG